MPDSSLPLICIFERTAYIFAQPWQGIQLLLVHADAIHTHTDTHAHTHIHTYTHRGRFNAGHMPSDDIFKTLEHALSGLSAAQVTDISKPWIDNRTELARLHRLIRHCLHRSKVQARQLTQPRCYEVGNVTVNIWFLIQGYVSTRVFGPKRCQQCPLRENLETRQFRTRQGPGNADQQVLA